MTPAWLGCSALLTVLAACAGVPDSDASVPAPSRQAPGRAVVSVELEVVGLPTARYLAIDSIALVAGEELFPLETDRESFSLAGRTRRLAEGKVPVGGFDGMRVELAGAWSDDPAQGGVPLLLDETSSFLSFPLRIADGEALSLLLSLELASEELDGIAMAPSWTLGLAASLLPSDMVLVADNQGSGVIVVDRDRRRVHRTLLPGHAIAGMALGFGASELLAVDATRDEVLALDLVTGTRRDRRRLPAGGRPVWATRLPSQRGIAIALAARRSVEILEVPSLISGSGQPTRRPPGRMASSRDLGRLFVLLPESDSVLVLSADADEVIAERSIESGPTDLSLSRRGDRLAVACKRAGRLVLWNASSLETVASYFLGQGIQTVVFDDQGDRIYVGFDRPPRLESVDLATGQSESWVPLPAAPADLELDPEGRVIWVACPNAGSVLAVDRFQLRIRSEVNVSGAPDRLMLPGSRDR